MKITLKQILLIIGITVAGVFVIRSMQNIFTAKNTVLTIDQIGQSSDGVLHYNLDTIIIPEKREQFENFLFTEVIKCYSSKECDEGDLKNSGDTKISLEAVSMGYAVQSSKIVYIDGDFVYTATPIDFPPQSVRIPLSDVLQYVDLKQPERVTQEINSQGIPNFEGAIAIDSIKKDFASGYTYDDSRYAYDDSDIASSDEYRRFFVIKENGVWKMVSIGSDSMSCEKAMEYKNEALTEEICN